jgi:beta-glucosidase
MWSKRLHDVAASGGRTTLVLAASAALLTGSILGGTGSSAVAADRPAYLDQHASVRTRVTDLLGRMTLAQKIGQMTQIEVSRVVGDCDNGPGPLNQSCAQNILGKDAVGSIFSGGGSPPTEDVNGADGPQAWATAVNSVVKYSVDHNPLHIPVTYGADVVHGHNSVLGDTMFPVQLGMGATYDPALEQATQVAAGKAALATGVRWGFGPVADVDRDTRWGRYYESFGEDPALTGSMEAAGVRGLQSSGQVAATIKHFAGYGGASTGLDRTDADMSIRWLQDDELPSYQAGLDAGGETVMVDSGAVNGVPATSSHYLLTTVLRDRMHFDGAVVSDWADIAALQNNYHLAADYEHAAALAINAGVDMAMEPYDADSFEAAVTKAVSDHLISTTCIDRAAGRVLALKFRTGVFDHPYVDASKANQTIGLGAGLARQAAAESSVVLQNTGNVLPLPATAKITVTGPNADSIPATLGGWSIGWQGPPAGSSVQAVTVLKGLQAAGGANVGFAATRSAAVAAAATTDDYVVVVGTGPGAEGPNDKRDPSLPADQQTEVAALVATGKPVVVVVVDDRPVTMGALQSSGGGITPAGLVMAWRPGTQGGAGVADVLYGAANPSGRLPVSWPKRNTDNPNSYLLLTLPNTQNANSPTYQPLFPFGAGLSYTGYSFGTVTAARAGQSVNVKVTVGNTGSRDGDLVVPVYVSQPLSDPVVPVQRLAGFTRVHLAAGQQSTVTVSVPMSRLAITQGDIDGAGPPSVEHGQYVFSSGALSSALPANPTASLNL